MLGVLVPALAVAVFLVRRNRSLPLAAQPV